MKKSMLEKRGTKAGKSVEVVKGTRNKGKLSPDLARNSCSMQK